MTQTPGQPQGGPPPLNLPGLDFSLDFSTPSAPAAPGAPAQPAGGLDFGGLTFNLGATAAPANPPPPPGAASRPAAPGTGLPDLGLNLGGGAPAKAGGSALDTDFGLPGLDLPSFDLGGSAAPAAPAAPKLGGGMPPMPKPAGGMPPMPKASPPRPASFLDASPSGGAGLGFSTPPADDVLGLGHKVEKSILDDTEVLAAPTAVVEKGSKNKVLMVGALAVILLGGVFGGLWTMRFSVRASLKGLVLSRAIASAEKAALGPGVDRRALMDSLASLRMTAVPNKAVEIYDLQVLGQDLKDLLKDGTLDQPEFERVQSRVDYLKSIRGF